MRQKNTRVLRESVSVIVAKKTGTDFMFPDIIKTPISTFKHNVSETGASPRLQEIPTQLDPIDIVHPSFQV
jgi:hypothetical protein